MQKHRTVRFVASLIFLGALVYFVLGIVLAIVAITGGLGAGWGIGWRGWLLISPIVGMIMTAISLLVFGCVLFFLTQIETNIAEARDQWKGKGRPITTPIRPSTPPAQAPTQPHRPISYGDVVKTTTQQTPSVRVTDQPKSAGSNLPGAADAARVASELRALKKPTDDKA